MNTIAPEDTQAVSADKNHGRQRRYPARRSESFSSQPVTFPSRGPGAVTAAGANSRGVLLLVPDLSLKYSDLGAFNADLCAPRTVAGTPEALRAAIAGDVKRADELELAWRNAWRVLPRVPAAELAEQRGRGLDLMTFSIQRNAGPAGETLIEWSWVVPCPRCWRRLALRARCHKCSGYGWIGDERDLFFADLNGHLVADNG